MNIAVRTCTKLWNTCTPILMEFGKSFVMHMPERTSQHEIFFPALTHCVHCDAIWWHRSGSTLVQVKACCPRHQAITWTYVDSSSKCSLAFTWEQFHKWSWTLIHDMSSKMTLLKLLPYLPGTSEWTHCGLVTTCGGIHVGSKLAQVMACCLTAPSHYLNQCWLIMSKAVHDMASRPLAQFDLILAWASWKLLWAT